MLINNCKLTIKELAEDLNIAYGSIQNIVVNGLDLRHVTAKLVPKELNFMQKRDRVVAKDMISKAESDPTSSNALLKTRRGFMSTTRNPDIRRVNGKLQMNQKKPRRFHSKKKAMLTVFMDYNGIVHHEFLPEG